MEIWDHEKTVEIDVNGSAEPLQFRIEAYRSRNSALYRVRLFRLDMFRLTPSFGPYPDGGADHDLYVADLIIDGEVLNCDTAEECLQHAIERLRLQGFS